MDFSIQPELENDKTKLLPLKENDFEELYQVASDPEIWEQHPNKDRYKREVFLNFFEGAIKSKGAFKIIDKTTGKIIGSTRYYDYNEAENSIHIGYTFYAKSYWGRSFNHTVKTLMLDYIFNYVSKVIFHIGAKNIRSQIAISRLGVEKTGEEEIAYHGEPSKLNFVYEITKNAWHTHQSDAI
ncbi:MAG: GNAT family N-acetyltransferase [Bacteroidetes bacterium]|jgi:RimJ/RimL family protein N-acetyltransferase|nr:GNAT family N-acetyltransferase [Bacteroidota bacterium]